MTGANGAKDEWREQILSLAIKLHSSLPNLTLAELVEEGLAIDDAAQRVLAAMWRLRGMRDAADLLVVVEQTSEQRRAAVFLSSQSEAGFAACAETLKKLVDLGARAPLLVPMSD